MSPTFRSLGIDVGAGARKQLDVVLMDQRKQPSLIASRVSLAQIEHLIREHKPDVVCIDSPPAWGPQGAGSRETERQLGALGIHSYATPSPERAEGKDWFGWMRVGFEVFRTAERAGYPRYRHGDPRGTAAEVFPHASATVLAGCLPPAGAMRGAKKKGWRLGVLRAQGVAVAGLGSLDQVDAALAALTGVIALQLGDPFAPGWPTEGTIMLPARVLPGRYERCETDEEDMPALIRFCACGCGAEVRQGREFRRGHDRKLMARLQQAVRDGQAAERELRRRKWL